MQSALLATIAFRHWNRTENWVSILTAFVRDEQPVPCQFRVLEEACEECKHKPFSRPVVWRDGPGDTAENAFALLRGIGRHIDFQRVANLLSNGIHCTADYDKFITYLHNISAAFPGTFGIYRRKNVIHLWVAVGAISPSAMTKILVSTTAGTAESLCYLYGLKTASEKHLSSLLNHLYANLRKSPQFGKQAESLCTAGLTLCGWHRDCQAGIVYNGVSMTGLDRAIKVEEEEYLSVRKETREMSIDLYDD